jgi:hypothetical protein
MVSSGSENIGTLEHQVNEGREHWNSMDWFRCSWEGSFHAVEAGFHQGRYGEILNQDREKKALT